MSRSPYYRPAAIAKRRAARQVRDRAILKAAGNGWSQSEIARSFKLSRAMVAIILNRDRP